MQVAILGDGAIARAGAAIAAERGHTVTLWSRSFGRAGTRLMRATGAIEGEYLITLAGSARDAVTNADSVLVAAPANAHRFLFETIAPELPRDIPVLVIAAASLGPRVLERLTEDRNPVGALGTTPATARTEGEHVRVLTIRAKVGVFGGPPMIALAESLWGDGRFDESPDLVAASLANINPIAHLPIALCNVTRIERHEVWPQYLNMTDSVCRLIEGLDDERLALARAYDTEVPTAEAHFARSYGTQADTLAAIAAEIHARRGGPPGPTDMDTRFITEDVPFGLVFYQWLARHKGVAMPLTDASVTLASAVWGRDLAAMNDLLPLLDPPE